MTDKSPPASPPPKQALKSLMIQQNKDQNPLTSFLKDCKESMIPKILAM